MPPGKNPLNSDWLCFFGGMPPVQSAHFCGECILDLDLSVSIFPWHKTALALDHGDRASRGLCFGCRFFADHGSRSSHAPGWEWDWMVRCAVIGGFRRRLAKDLFYPGVQA